MQLKYHMVTIEDLVPENHFLRELEKSLDLSFVYEGTEHLYSREYGRPPMISPWPTGCWRSRGSRSLSGPSPPMTVPMRN